MSRHFHALLAAGLSALAAHLTHAAPPLDLAAALRQWLGDSTPGGVAAAWVDADGVVFAAAGTHAADDPRPLTPDTYFEIGSLTKPFTGLLLAEAITQGRATLDGVVGKPFASSDVTYRQLVTHAAGLPRMASAATGGQGPADMETLQQAFAAQAPAAVPGRSRYSNFGYSVLGQAIAAAWGRSYAEALRERVLTPLGLDDTFVAWTEVDASRLAPGHGGAGRVPNVDFRAESPAGSLISTTRELARFVQANLGLVDTPLNALIERTHLPLADGDHPMRKIAYAWVVESRGPDTLLWHNGSTTGYRSFLVFNPETKTGLVLLGNAGRPLEALGFALLSGRQPPPPRALPAEVKLAPEQLAACAGLYTLGSVEFTVTVEDGGLYVQLTGQPRNPLAASAPDRFFFRNIAAEISFERDAAGAVVALVLHQGGRDQRAVRK